MFARFLAKHGEEECSAELLKAVAPTRQEPDNIRYDLHQAADQPAVLFHERWRDQAALRSHT